MNKIVLAAAIAASVAAFPALAEEDSAVDPLLTIWTRDATDYNAFSKVAERYTKETGIKVKIENQEQSEIKFEKAASRGEGPDIYLWAHDRFGQWANAGLIAPVSPSEEEKAKFFRFSWDALTMQGKTWGYPISVEAISMICNRSIIEDKDVPDSLEDLVKLDDELQKKGIHAIEWDYSQPYYSFPVMASQGAYVYKKTATGYDVNDTGVGNQGARTGLKFIVSLIKDKHIVKGTDYGIMQDDFVNGRVACVFDGPWSWSNYEQAKVDFSVNRLPTLNGKRMKAMVGVLGLIINAHSKKKDIAIQFIEKYVLTDEGMSEMNDRRSLGAFALKSFQAKSKNDPRVNVTMQNAQDGEPMPSVPQMIKFWSAIQGAITNSTSGRQDVDAALSTAHQRVLN